MAGNNANVEPLVSTTITSRIDNPNEGYRIYFDGPNLITPLDDLQSGWEQQKLAIVSRFQVTLQAYVDATQMDVAEGAVETLAKNMANFERALAQNIVDGATFENMNNAFTRANASEQFDDTFDFETFFKFLASWDTSLANRLNAAGYTFAIATPDNWQKFTAVLQSRKDVDGNDITRNTILSYIYFRCVWDKRDYLPDGDATSFAPSTTTRFVQRRKTLPDVARAGYHRQRLPVPSNHPIFAEAKVTNEEQTCAELLEGALLYASDRLFVDAVFDGQDARNDARLMVGSMVEAASVQFGALLEQLPWLDTKSRKAANAKLNGYVQ